MSLLAGIAVASTLLSLKEGADARSDQRKAERVNRKIRERETQRQRIAQLREQRIAQAQIKAQAASQGIQGSSAAEGAYAAVGSQVMSNIAFTNQIQDLQQRVQGYQQSAAQQAGNAQAFGSLAGLAMTASGMD